MDERLRFVARVLDGEKMPHCTGSSGFPERPATRSSIATRTVGSRGSPTAAAARIGRPTGCRDRSRRSSSWWLRVGIAIERIKHGHPEQNGRHARIHLTLKKEATKPAAENSLQQQASFDDFIDEFNNERPHQALDMKLPGERYRPSKRRYRGLEHVDYPFHDRTITVTQYGRVCFGKQKINLSKAFAGQNVGIKEVADDPGSSA